MLNSLQSTPLSIRSVVAPTLFGQLDEELQSKLLASAPVRTFASDQIIQQRGDDPSGFWVIEEGLVKIAIFGREGDFRVIALLGAGDSYGELAMFAGNRRAVDAVADGHVRARWIDAPTFERMIMQDPAAMRRLIGALSAELQEMLSLVASLGNKSALSRIAAILTTLAQSGSGVTTIALSQQELGELSGLTRVTVNKCLAQLEAVGALKRAYGQVEITNLCLIQSAAAN